jgi:hypothetical protein
VQSARAQKLHNSFKMFHFSRQEEKKLSSKKKNENHVNISTFVSANDIDQNCKYLRTYACIRALIKRSQAKLKQLRLAD